MAKLVVVMKIEGIYVKIYEDGRKKQLGRYESLKSVSKNLMRLSRSMYVRDLETVEFLGVEKSPSHGIKRLNIKVLIRPVMEITELKVDSTMESYQMLLQRVKELGLIKEYRSRGGGYIDRLIERAMEKTTVTRWVGSW